MKFLLLILALPVFSFAQTIHIKDDKIVYEGTVKTSLGTSETFKRVQSILPEIVHDYKVKGQAEDSIVATGELKLKTPYHLKRTVAYSIKITKTGKGYQYLIDSVFFLEQERGKKVVVKSSEEMIENMDETGPIVGETEKILNETDMRFQKLLDNLEYEIKKTPS